MTRLILGTAQLGSAYGITNNRQLNEQEVSDILASAEMLGIDTLDTAPGYGEAESRIGRLRRDSASFRYITKFSLASVDAISPVQRSLEMLRTPSLEGLLAHRIEDLEEPGFSVVLRGIVSAKRDGLLKHFGASIYEKKDLELVEKAMPGFTLLQLPGNVVDTRLLDSPEVRRLRERGVEIHVRSAFLQGLLLADQSTLPSGFGVLAPTLRDLDEAAEEAGTSRLSLLLGALRFHPNCDAVVVGASNAGELREIADAWGRAKTPVDYSSDPLPDWVLDPRTWP